jgi:hypothetical protein
LPWRPDSTGAGYDVTSSVAVPVGTFLATRFGAVGFPASAAFAATLRLAGVFAFTVFSAAAVPGLAAALALGSTADFGLAAALGLGSAAVFGLAAALGLAAG